jgi:hypothetical protein
MRRPEKRLRPHFERIAAKNFDEVRDFTKMIQSVLHTLLIQISDKINIEMILPCFVANRSRLNLGEIDIP